MACLTLAPARGVARADDASTGEPTSAAMLVSGREAEPLSRLVRARATELGAVDIATTPALSLRDLQLSVGCLNESAQCLDEVATLLEVEGLLRIEVEETPDQRVAVLSWHRRGKTRVWRTVTESVPASRTRASLLASVDALLRELFRLPAEPPPASESSRQRAIGEAELDPPAAAGSDTTDAGLSLGPVLTGAIAVAAAGGGVALALSSRDKQRAWESAPTGTAEEVDQALDTYQAATRQARAANAMFAIAGAVGAAAVAWLIVDLSSSPDDASAPSLALGPMGASLTWTVELGGAR